MYIIYIHIDSEFVRKNFVQLARNFCVKIVSQIISWLT